MNITRSNEYVPEIELQIRVVKESARCTRHSLPFNRTPRLLLVHIVFFYVNFLNDLPIKGLVSAMYNPKTIMSGETL